MKNLAKVVIIGRANVGKSTLFNRLSVDIKSLTLDYEGVTRDFISDVVCWQNTCFQLTDSGGISLQKLHEPLAEKVRQIALKLVDTADLVLLMVDGSVGFLPQDRAIVQYLHKAKKNIILVINKADIKRTHENIAEFLQSGIKNQIMISAQHGKGIDILLETIIAQLPKKIASVTQPEPSYSVVLLGKPNVGKSSLLNFLVESERMLVTPQAGTTREAITETVNFYQETIALTDTPGVRRQRAITRESLESMMVKTSFVAVKRAQIVLLMVDGTEGQFADQELKLAFYVFEQGKALIILFNKDDLMTDLMRSDLKRDMEQYQYFFKKIPMLAISAKTGKNIGKILPLTKKIWQRYSQRFDDMDIARILKAAIKRKPLYHQSERLIIYDAKQISTAPITITLSVNEPDWFGPSQIAFLENALRKQFDLIGVPILFKAVK